MLKKFYFLFKRFIMGLVNKKPQTNKEEEALTKPQVEFILNKLRSATYRGDEFEQFFHIIKKLSDHLKTLE